MNRQTLISLRALRAAQSTYTKAVAAELHCSVNDIEFLRRVSAVDDAYELAEGGGDYGVIVNETTMAWQHSPEKLRAAAQLALLRIDSDSGGYAELLLSELGAGPDARSLLRRIAEATP